MCRNIQVLGDTIVMIVERFSELILACKSKLINSDFVMHVSCDVQQPPLGRNLESLLLWTENSSWCAIENCTPFSTHYISD